MKATTSTEQAPMAQEVSDESAEEIEIVRKPPFPTNFEVRLFVLSPVSLASRMIRQVWLALPPRTQRLTVRHQLQPAKDGGGERQQRPKQPKLRSSCTNSRKDDFQREINCPGIDILGISGAALRKTMGSLCSGPNSI